MNTILSIYSGCGRSFLGVLACLAVFLVPFWTAVNVFAGTDDMFTPYIEQHPQGSIDWDNGMIYGLGRAYIDAHADRSKALAAARSMASSNIVKLAAGLRLDDVHVMKSLGKGRLSIRLEAFVTFKYEQKNQVTREGRSCYEVIRMTPLKGVEGLTARLIDHYRNEPVPWMQTARQAPASLDSDDQLPWLVLDARHLAGRTPVQPAVFPKIQTQKGQVIYSSAHVFETALKQRGMARYVSSTMSADQLKSSWKNDMDLLAQVLAIFSPRPAAAQEQKPERKRRKLVVKKVNEAAGLMKTNLVISAEDAKALKKEDAASRILKNCRVIVVVSSPIGGIDGMLDFLMAGRNPGL